MKRHFILLPLFLLLSSCGGGNTSSGVPDEANYCTSVVRQPDGTFDADGMANIGTTAVVTNNCGELITVATAGGQRFELSPGQSRRITLLEGETVAACRGSRTIKFLSLTEAICA